MNVEIEKISPEFTPIRVTILLENAAEASALAYVANAAVHDWADHRRPVALAIVRRLLETMTNAGVEPRAS